MIHIGKRGIRNGQAVGGIHHIQRLPALSLQLLVGLDHQTLVIDHGVEIPLQEHILQPVGAAGGAVYAGEQLCHLIMESFAFQIGGCDGFRVSQQGIKKSDVSAGPRVRLSGAGHTEFQLSPLYRPQQIADSDLFPHKAQLSSQALPDAEHHWRNGNGLGVL